MIELPDLFIVGNNSAVFNIKGVKIKGLFYNKERKILIKDKKETDLWKKYEYYGPMMR
jgi:hypothetical protein